MKMELKTRNMDDFFTILGKNNSGATNGGGIYISNDDDLIKETVEHLKKGYDKEKGIFIEEKYTSRQKEYIPLEILRLMIMVMMKKIKELNSEITLYDIGYEFGRYINPKNYRELKKFFRKNNLGMLKIESKKPLVVKVNDCALCDGLKSDEPICYFDAGVLAGAYECILNKTVVVDEIKCMAQGADACYFKIEPVK
ncbi:V4R domain-containing protein [Methanothermococcus okinawensis]|uniref:4-vinyl reductase 4VR n=1 Tax=Methanothermococcus okinawensis (strain DSM 14208 / JCM 11175 / IH1) TaxID=647113 RepID=F8AL75_METOI|nr:V4R domain-containing protein [Methanothermococcus okinawensis]AEH06607.1 4-vinyl reductase 4VR [Methanothermococcus okinawensis IH1]